MQQSTYSLAGHTLLPLIFKINISNRFTYLLKDPLTHSLLLLNPKPLPKLSFHIDQIQKATHSKLSRILINSYNKGDLEGHKVDSYGFHHQCSKKVEDLRPFTVGELAVCFLGAPGVREDNAFVIVTHVTEQSTKLPVIFCGGSLGICCVGETERDDRMVQSLEKIKYFPNETLLFPDKIADIRDLQFALALDPNNQIVKYKIDLFEKSKQDDRLIPSTLIEEKNSNPFLNLRKYSSLLGTNDPVKAFGIMKKLKNEFMKKR